MDGLYEVVAGCFSRDSAVNAETGRSYGVDEDRVYDSYADLLAKEREKLDAVVVLTPPVLHEAPVVSAMEAGVPVICEKPLATTPQEARAIREAERRNKAFLAVTYNYTGYPALRELRSLIHEGRLGKLLHFSAEMPQESFLRVDRRGHPLKPQEWRLKDGAIPKVYLDLASHLHQISHYLMDIVPTRVVAHHRSYGNFPGIVDYVDAAVDYGDDVHGTYYFGKSMLGYRNGLRIRVFGDRGSADWEQANPEELRMAYADGRLWR
jgi:predicted dehydrogenase